MPAGQPEGAKCANRPPDRQVRDARRQLSFVRRIRLWCGRPSGEWMRGWDTPVLYSDPNRYTLGAWQTVPQNHHDLHQSTRLHGTAWQISILTGASRRE